MLGSPTKYIHFHNDTDLPIVVDGWVSTSYGLSTLKGLTVQSGEKLIVASGNYSWMEYDDSPFECVYSEFAEPIENVFGMITFRQKT